MYVACSTQCFGRSTLTDAFKSMGEIGFTKADVALTESGHHLKPSEICADPAKAAQKLKSWPGVAPSAFHVEPAPELSQADLEAQIKAIARLARVLAVPVISLPAAATDSDVDAEVARLTALSRICSAEGVNCTVETRIGTLTETPAGAVNLCRRTPGLGLTLDPSHFLAGPCKSQNFDEIYPYVKHVRLRDTGNDAEHFQVRIGQGQVEYGRIVTQLARFRYNRLLSVDIHDEPDQSYPMQPEVRKLKYLLESLI